MAERKDELEQKERNRFIEERYDSFSIEIGGFARFTENSRNAR